MRLLKYSLTTTHGNEGKKRGGGLTRIQEAELSDGEFGIENNKIFGKNYSH